MKKRIYVALIMLAVLAGTFAFRFIPDYGNYIFDMLVGVVAIFCSMEISKILSGMNILSCSMAAGVYPSLMFAGHVVSFLFELKIYFWIAIQVGILLLSSLAVFIIFVSLNNKYVKDLRNKTNLSRCKLAWKITLSSFISFVYPCFMFAFFMLLGRFDELKYHTIAKFDGQLSWLVLLCAVLVPIVTDTCAMLFGKLLKGPKLCEKISPKKTISGAVSAVLISAVVMGAVYILFKLGMVYKEAFTYSGIKIWHFMLFGMLCSLVSQIGDLFESFLKRKAGVKDSGNIFPGHGGFLDRLDSHLFSAPFTFIFFFLLFII